MSYHTSATSFLWSIVEDLEEKGETDIIMDQFNAEIPMNTSEAVSFLIDNGYLDEDERDFYNEDIIRRLIKLCRKAEIPEEDYRMVELLNILIELCVEEHDFLEWLEEQKKQ